MGEVRVVDNATLRANYVCIHNGELVATVFSTAWQPWHVILHYHPKDPVLLTGECFIDLSDAMSRAEEIVSGASEGAYLVALPLFWEPGRS